MLVARHSEVSVDGLVFGFPCVDTCRAGKMKDIIKPRSTEQLGLGSDALGRGVEGYQLFATPPDDSLQEHIAQNSGLAFNGGRPPPTEWMMPRAEHKHVKARLTQLGNAVIPLQAIVVARLLSSAFFCP